MIDSGRSVPEVARELSIVEHSLYRWVREERRRLEAAAAAGEEPLTPAEREELIRLRRELSELRKDNEFCGKSGSLTTHVNPPGYYRWLSHKDSPSVTEQQRRDLAVRMLASHKESNGTYGARRITSDLKELGESVSRNTVAASDERARDRGHLSLGPSRSEPPFAIRAPPILPTWWNVTSMRED